MAKRSSNKPAHLSVVPKQGDEAKEAAAAPLTHPVGGSEVYDLMRKPETPAEHIKRLQDEAKILAKEQIHALEKALLDAVRQAEEIARGGEAYPVGARELCRNLVEDITARAQTLKAITDRT